VTPVDAASRTYSDDAASVFWRTERVVDQLSG
jgi:hypothetical protein